MDLPQPTATDLWNEEVGKFVDGVIADVVHGAIACKEDAKGRVLEARPDDFRRACLDDLKTRPEYLALRD